MNMMKGIWVEITRDEAGVIFMIYSVSIINRNIKEELGLIKQHISIPETTLTIHQRHNQQKRKLTVVHTICQWSDRKGVA